MTTPAPTPSTPETGQVPLEQLICPICFHTYEDRVWQCRNGHLICDSCFKRLPPGWYLCPQCRIDMGGPNASRNTFVEGVFAKNRTLSCRYHQLGCGVKCVSSEDAMEHEGKCRFGRCLNLCHQIGFPFCNFEVHLASPTASSDLEAHLREVHSRGNEWPINDNFFKVMKASKAYGNFQIPWFTIISRPEPSSPKYLLTCKIQGYRVRFACLDLTPIFELQLQPKSEKQSKSILPKVEVSIPKPGQIVPVISLMDVFQRLVRDEKQLMTGLEVEVDTDTAIDFIVNSRWILTVSCA